MLLVLDPGFECLPFNETDPREWRWRWIKHLVLQELSVCGWMPLTPPVLHQQSGLLLSRPASDVISLLYLNRLFKLLTLRCLILTEVDLGIVQESGGSSGRSAVTSNCLKCLHLFAKLSLLYNLNW